MFDVSVTYLWRLHDKREKEEMSYCIEVSAIYRIYLAIASRGRENKNKKFKSFKSKENIHKKEYGPDCTVSDN